MIFEAVGNPQVRKSAMKGITASNILESGHILMKI